LLHLTILPKPRCLRLDKEKDAPSETLKTRHTNEHLFIRGVEVSQRRPYITKVKRSHMGETTTSVGLYAKEAVATQRIILPLPTFKRDRKRAGARKKASLIKEDKPCRLSQGRKGRWGKGGIWGSRQHIRSKVHPNLARRNRERETQRRRKKKKRGAATDE